MPFDLHIIETVDGATPLARTDRIIVAHLPQVANAAGGSAGAAVTVPITGLTLPNVYGVHVTPGSGVIASVLQSSKTNGGFSVVLMPLSGSLTVAAGAIDVLVVA
jgi:hypothetical protein